MNDLITAIEAAFLDPENEELTSKAHRLFLSHQFILPIERNKSEPTVLFLAEGDKQFIPFFSNETLFERWAGDLLDEMNFLQIMGKDLVLGTSDSAYLCLDVGSPHYKEFEPSEIQRLKKVVLKLERIIKAGSTV